MTAGHGTLFSLALAIALVPACASAAEKWVWAGEQVAKRNCAECHAIAPGKASPFADAPTFPKLRTRIDRTEMARTLDERMRVLHPRMPPLNLDPDEVDEFLDYWDSLTPDTSAPRAKEPPLPSEHLSTD